MMDPRLSILQQLMGQQQQGALGNSVFGQQQPMGPQMIQGSEMPKMPQMPQMQQPGGDDMTDIMDMFFGG